MENSEDRCVSLLADTFDAVAGHVSDGVFRQLSSTNPASLNMDNAFGNVVASIQYHALADKANDAFYKLGNTKTPIQAYVFDVITASVQKLNLDDVFKQKNAIAKAVEEEFEMAMSAGYEIVQTLVVDIEPDEWAMNEINPGGSQLLKSLESMEMKCVIAKNLKPQELQQPRSPSLEESQGVTKFAIEDGGYCITVQKNVTPEKVFAKLIDSNEEQHRRRCLVQETLETTMEKLKAVACQSLSWRKQLIATIEDSGKCSESSASDCNKGLVQQLLLQEAKIENSKQSSSRTNSSPTKETHVDQFSRGKRKASQSPEGDPCRQKASTSSSPPPRGSSSAGYHRSLNILYTKSGRIGQTCLSNKWKNGIKVTYQRLDSESDAAYYSGLLKRFWEGEGIIKECFTGYKSGSKDIVAVQRVEDFSTWLEDYLRKSTCQCYSTSIRKLLKEILMGIKCLHQEKVAHGNMKNGVGITFEGHAKLMLMKKYKKAFKDVAVEDFAGLEYFVKKINNFHKKYHGVIPPDAADFSEILKNPTSWEKSIWIYNHPFTYTASERILSVIRLSDFLWRNDLIDDLSKVMEPWTTFKDWPEKLIWGTPMHACLHHGHKLSVDGRIGALPRFIVNCQSQNQSKVKKNKNKGKDRYDAELEVFKYFPAVYVEFHKGLRILWEGRERKDPAERKIIRNFFKNEL